MDQQRAQITASPQIAFSTDFITLPVSASHRRFGSLPLAAEEGHARVLPCQLHRALHSKHAQAASPDMSGLRWRASGGYVPAPGLIWHGGLKFWFNRRRCRQVVLQLVVALNLCFCRQRSPSFLRSRIMR
ncbi:hypothetical protein G3N94_02325 [Burkholderia sp. Ac-20353]|nr:hypothetical protein [Burkholderia sp. Ac-20353]